MPTNFSDFQNEVYAEAVKGVTTRYPFDFSSIDPDGFVVDTPMGRYTGVKEMIEMSKTPGEYKHPLTPLGSWQPSWL